MFGCMMAETLHEGLKGKRLSKEDRDEISATVVKKLDESLKELGLEPDADLARSIFLNSFALAYEEFKVMARRLN